MKFGRIGDPKPSKHEVTTVNGLSLVVLSSSYPRRLSNGAFRPGVSHTTYGCQALNLLSIVVVGGLKVDNLFGSPADRLSTRDIRPAVALHQWRMMKISQTCDLHVTSFPFLSSIVCSGCLTRGTEASRELFKHSGRLAPTRNSGVTWKEFSSSMMIQDQSRQCSGF
jgi:hypothetical protein